MSATGSADPLRLSRWSALASLLLGIVTFGMTWGNLRLRVLHPNPWPTVVLFLALGAASAVAVACGLWRALRGPRRMAAGSLALAAIVPAILWGYVGFYASSQWGRRRVPNDLAMNLAKVAGASLIRLEASSEYPNRIETGRLVMFYGRLGDPRGDAEAMDRHLARMEARLGGPLRAKVYWVRGGLSRLGLSGLSVHGIALGSGESPGDWRSGGHMDRHELAHAALDEYRIYGADPPYVLHEGWAEAQSGVGSVVLARRALEQREAEPSLGLREMVGPDWYHRDAGPVYPLGGAFVDFLLRKHGAGKFLRLYNGSREGAFDAACRADLGALEAEFWEDAREVAGGDGPREHGDPVNRPRRPPQGS